MLHGVFHSKTCWRTPDRPLSLPLKGNPKLRLATRYFTATANFKSTDLFIG